MWKLVALVLVTLSAGLSISRNTESMGSESEGYGRWCTIKTDLPQRCTKGNDHWSHDELQQAVPDFIEFYKTKPIRRNSGGGNTNHAFALWYTIKKLQPKYIIESGVYHGSTTWLMRQVAGPDTKIISIDPHELEFLEFQDKNKNTQYFMGNDFKDFAEIDWDAIIPKEDRDKTLVFLDDHQSSIRRVKEMLKFGFVHLWYDDNYKTAPKWIGRTYSFNMMCSDLSENALKKQAVAYPDQFGKSESEITLAEHEENVKFLQDHTDIYFEFPPLFDRCASKGRRNLLEGIGVGAMRDDNGVYVDVGPKSQLTLELEALGLPRVRADPYQYNTQYPPYVKLKL